MGIGQTLQSCGHERDRHEDIRTVIETCSHTDITRDGHADTSRDIPSGIEREINAGVKRDGHADITLKSNNCI
jgi:hypothetical protein